MTGFEYFLFGLLKAALTGAVAGSVISLVCLNWDRICRWFQARISLKARDIDNVGFSLQERLASGDYRTVYGIFNKKTHQVLDTETVSSGRIDDTVAEVHRGTNLVLFPN
ncbi:hypothetical protein GMLC_10560 [Geomonas limicola]|uniref:Uncharacterized protein n=1 Tax=Geomonas limicola TaxID=2740186 RepID=A0A6V8N6M1_9BACT|nr:hypothetical protein [Geomonas limicola]GFO67477.1 hypothetical protein GMLC_10560 [Geomonas limicola]